MFFRLCWRAPLTVILLMGMDFLKLGTKAGPPPSSEKLHSIVGAGKVSAQLYSVCLQRSARWSISPRGKERAALGSTTCPYKGAENTCRRPKGPTPLVIMKFEPKLSTMHCNRGNQPGPGKGPSKSLDDENNPSFLHRALYHSVFTRLWYCLRLRCYQRDPARFRA